MNIKLLISSLTILSASATNGQTLKLDTLKPIITETDSLIRWQCHSGASILSKDNYPLIIINGKTFKNCLLQNIFFEFDTAIISKVHVLNPQNDSVKLYGKSGKNGVIIITTKRPIEWISAKQILKQKSNEIFASNTKTLIKVNNALFDTSEELYFQKNLIENIYISNDTKQYYLDKKYNSVVTISITNQSGT